MIGSAVQVIFGSYSEPVNADTAAVAVVRCSIVLLMPSNDIVLFDVSPQKAVKSWDGNPCLCTNAVEEGLCTGSSLANNEAFAGHVHPADYVLECR